MSKKVTLEWQTDTQPPRDYDDYLVTWKIRTKTGVQYAVAVSIYDANEGLFECPVDGASCIDAEAVSWAEIPKPYVPEE